MCRCLCIARKWNAAVYITEPQRDAGNQEESQSSLVGKEELSRSPPRGHSWKQDMKTKI